MKRRYEAVRRALIDADIEGLLEMGAPEDEYDVEARMIAQRIADRNTRADSTPLSCDAVSAVVRDVWIEMFGPYDVEGLARRAAGFEAVARRIVEAEPR